MGQFWVVGSLNIDLIVECERFPLAGETLRAVGYREVPGGKGGNQAMALARLGARPRMVGAVGDDARGMGYRRTLAAAGVEVGGLRTDPERPTGLALIEVAAGENRIVVVPGANGGLTDQNVVDGLADLAPGDLVLLQLEIPLAAVFAAIRHVRSRGARVILDPAPATDLPDEILALVDFLTPNETEARVLARTQSRPSSGADDLAAARSLVARGCATVVQKSGASGVWAVTKDHVLGRPSFPAQVVDTVGAGDAFNAGFAFALGHGWGLAEALDWGNAAGSLSTRAAGAQDGQPSREEVETLVGPHR
jgi:ribokinase